MSRSLRIACYVIALSLLLSIVSWFMQGRLWFMPLRVAVSQLEQTLHFLQQQGLTSYRNQSWCKHLAYARGKFSETPQASTCNLFEGEAQAFSPEAEASFASIRQRLRASGLRVAFIISALREDDLMYEFHLNCWVCARTRLVYAPGYTLPEDTKGEIWYQPINRNWYQVNEDWN